MTEQRKLSFAEGMAKLHKAYLEKKKLEVTDNSIVKKNVKKKVKTKSNFNDFIWISEYKKPPKINFHLKRSELELCFIIEGYNFSSGTTKSKFLLSGINVRRPWLLWKEEWNCNDEKFQNLRPILGISKFDTEDAKEALIEFFSHFISQIDYKIKSDYIEDSLLISENEILKIIESK